MNMGKQINVKNKCKRGWNFSRSCRNYQFLYNKSFPFGIFLFPLFKYSATPLFSRFSFKPSFPNFSYRSSRPEVFCKKGVPGIFSKFTGKHLCQSLFFNKVTGLRLKFANFKNWNLLIDYYGHKLLIVSNSRVSSRWNIKDGAL